MGRALGIAAVARRCLPPGSEGVATIDDDSGRSLSDPRGIAALSFAAHGVRLLGEDAISVDRGFRL